MLFARSFENPVLVPENDLPWEANGAFNGSVIHEKGVVHMVYRAQSLPLLHSDEHWLSVSSIGYASSQDGIHFDHRKQLIKPAEPWERYGCEDPRIVTVGKEYFIFYTALSEFPFRPEGIRIAVAIGKNPRAFPEKHLVTPFNAKAMTLFPEKIQGKYWAILTVHTDKPPARVAVAAFEKKEDIWNRTKWFHWHEHLDEHDLPIQRNKNDHIEVGASPLKTPYGWIVLYSYIQNYATDRPIFSVEALLLDLKNPKNILGKTEAPILVPEEEYEIYGKVPNIVFPSGAFIKRKKIFLYYGAADTTTCLAVGDSEKLLRELLVRPENRPRLKRYKKNPILPPIQEHPWESKAVYNPAAIRLGKTTYLLYRAQSNDDTCTFGYAETQNGYDISYRHPDPVYIPRMAFEKKIKPSGNSGCEDPRITEFDGRLILLYTAYDGTHPPPSGNDLHCKKIFSRKKIRSF